MTLDLNASFSMAIEVMPDDDRNGDEERKHSEYDDPNDDH